jgi:hypothetical protein
VVRSFYSFSVSKAASSFAYSSVRAFSVPLSYYARLFYVSTSSSNVEIYPSNACYSSTLVFSISSSCVVNASTFD